jgi:hypothetical protein
MKKEREMAKVMLTVELTFFKKAPAGMVTMPRGAQRSLSVPAGEVAQYPAAHSESELQREPLEALQVVPTTS